MEMNLKAGISYSAEKKVSSEDTAIQYNSGLVEVFATPAMIAFIENTCMNCVQPLLPAGYGTVGFEVHIKHLRPTPVFENVKCQAVLSNVDKRKLVFEIQVYDGKGKIGEGKHTRYIVNHEKFMKNLSD